MNISDIIIKLASYDKLTKTDNLLRSIFYLYLNANPDANKNFCNYVVEHIKNAGKEKKGGADADHYDINFDYEFTDQNVNKIKLLIPNIHIKKYTTNDDKNNEKIHYDNLIKCVYGFNTPHILTLIGDCENKIITMKAPNQLFQFLKYKNDFRNFFSIGYLILFLKKCTIIFNQKLKK